MAKIIHVDFSKRGKELYYLKKQRKEEQRWQKREDNYYRAIAQSQFKFN